MKMIPAITLVILAALSSGLGFSCKGGYSGKSESIRLATLHLETSALIYIAENKQFFSENGLTLTIQDHDTGVAAIDAVLNGQADMAGLSEFVMVGKVLLKRKVSVLGTFNKSLTTNLIALRNRGISKVSDLAGKRIGLGRGTSPEFYLGRFLELHGAKIKEVVIIDLPPSKWQDAISSGAVDAIVGWMPYTKRIEELFINGTVKWQVQSGQPVFGIMVGSNDWIANHPETIIRFWKSLAKAEEFLARHPDEAKAIVQKRLNYDDRYMETVWPQYTFSLSLDQPLILAMEDEARWMIKNNLTTEKQVPDFLGYIYEDGLKAVKPETVKIIR
jgi:ABC-type nitrate/sulfonate/bicarbonate transport system substrate-binding protein